MKTKNHLDPLKTNGGFSLIELLIVISVMAILLAMATPSFIDWRRNLQYKEAAEGIVSALRTARNNAITLNRQNRVECNPSGNRYRITEGNRAYESSSWTTVKQDWVTLPGGVAMKTGDCTSSTDANIGFSPNGTASAGTVCIRDDSSTKYQVIVAASGRIRSVKP